jgi:hypothetical protein
MGTPNYFLFFFSSTSCTILLKGGRVRLFAQATKTTKLIVTTSCFKEGFVTRRHMGWRKAYAGPRLWLDTKHHWGREVTTSPPVSWRLQWTHTVPEATHTLALIPREPVALLTLRSKVDALWKLVGYTTKISWQHMLHVKKHATQSHLMQY